MFVITNVYEILTAEVLAMYFAIEEAIRMMEFVRYEDFIAV